MRWYRMSAGFLTDPKVEQLGEKHGPAGPLVIVSLLSHACLQEKGGEVERTWRAISNETFVDRGEVESIVEGATENGLCHTVSRDVTGCLLRFPAWKKHQAAARKAEQREREKTTEKPHGKADVTPSHEVSRDVPYKTRQDKTKKKEVPPPKSAPLSHLLADLIVENGSKRPTVTQEWVSAEDRMLRLDKRDPEEAARLIRWCQASDFWRPNILSMPKFREKYDTLRLQAGSQPKPKPDRSAYARMVKAA